MRFWVKSECSAIEMIRTNKFWNNRVFCFWVILLVVVGTGAGADEQKRVNVALNPDGSTFSFVVPGTLNFKGSFSATLTSCGQTRELLSAMGKIAWPAGQTQELRSVEGRLVLPVEQFREEIPCGRASVTEVTIRFAQ